MNLKNRISALTVFRDLLSDAVIAALLRYLETEAVTDYCNFVSLLYKANAGNLTDYIERILSDSENVYVRIVGKGESVPSHIHDSMLYELATLEKVAGLASDELCQTLTDSRTLPRYEVSDFSVAESYKRRIENIGRYGYVQYACNRMFSVNDDGTIIPVKNADKTTLAGLIDYRAQRDIVIKNTESLLRGQPAANILLTGDAGTGKSSTVKAVCNEFFCEGLRLIEVRKDQLAVIPKILDNLAENPLKFILFIDDLSFLTDDDNFNGLKAVLEGSVAARPNNVAVYATSNRRHIVKEKFSDREGDDIHINDTVQEIISLSDRFGIQITFNRPDKATYLDIVRNLARESGIDTPEQELEAEAERFALVRGGRSARLARQFVDSLLSKSAMI